MNNTVYYDASCSDEERRRLLYEGQLFVYSPRKSTLAFIEFARTLIKEAFSPYDPETAQYELSGRRVRGSLTEAKAGVHPSPRV